MRRLLTTILIVFCWHTAPISAAGLDEHLVKLGTVTLTIDGELSDLIVATDPTTGRGGVFERELMGRRSISVTAFTLNDAGNLVAPFLTIKVRLDTRDGSFDLSEITYTDDQGWKKPLVAIEFRHGEMAISEFDLSAENVLSGSVVATLIRVDLNENMSDPPIIQEAAPVNIEAVLSLSLGAPPNPT